MIARCSTRTIFTLLAVVCLQVGVASESFASLPVMSQVLPRGIQRGAQHTLTFVGKRLDDAEEILFYDDGIRFVDLKVISPEKVEVAVEVDSDCRIGEHMVQVRTRTGVSGYRIIHVEAYPAVAEAEKANDDRDTAQLIEPSSYSESYPDGVGVVVGGQVGNEDHDWYAVDGVAGQRLSVEVVGMRLGDFCDALMEIFDPAGKRIAQVDDNPFSKQDPCVSLVLPTDGRYLIHLTDSAGKGDKNARYRMHVGNFPRPTTAVPALVRRNKLSEVSFLGDANGPIKQTLQIDDGDLYQNGIHVRDRFGSSPTPVFMQVVDEEFEIVEEVEPNDKHKKVERELSVPFSVHGKIDKFKDRDVFRFKATKGQRIRVETFGHRIGSNIDTLIRVRGEKNRSLSANTDAAGLDSRLVVTIPSDGSYTVEVENTGASFGSDVRYQLDVQVEQPSFNFAIMEVQRYVQHRQQVAVPAGNRFAIMLTAQRNEFDGPFELEDAGLPESVRMFARPMPVGATTMPVVFEADAAKSGQTHGQLVELLGQSIVDSKSDSSSAVAGRYRNSAQLMRVMPGNQCMKFGVVEKVAVAVLDPVPFKVDLVPPSSAICQNGQMKLRINVTREKDFKAPVTLRLPFRPPGIAAAPTIRVNPNQTTADYPISANAKAAVATWPICVTAVAPNDNGTMISTGLHDLKVVTPFVAIRGDMVSSTVDSDVIAKCRVEMLKRFEGTAEVRLVQLPAHVKSEPQTFSAEDQAVEFPISVGEKCVTKRNHSVKLQVTIEEDGQPVVFDAGRLLMRFSGESKREKKSSRRQPVKVSKGSGGQQ